MPAKHTLQGEIYQRVDTTGGIIDNVVTLRFPKPFFPPDAKQPALQACLRHSYSVSDGSEVKIVYESTTAEPLLDRCACKPCFLRDPPPPLAPPGSPCSAQPRGA